jgi:hypothetical protein
MGLPFRVRGGCEDFHRTRLDRPALFPRRAAGAPLRAGLRTSRFSSLAMGGVWAGGGVFFSVVADVVGLVFFMPQASVFFAPKGYSTGFKNHEDA